MLSLKCDIAKFQSLFQNKSTARAFVALLLGTDWTILLHPAENLKKTILSSLPG
jgi:hypothetical protein